MPAKKSLLKTRLEPRRLPLLLDEAAQLKVVQSWVEEDHQKLLLLCDEMGIPDGPSRFYMLSLALARKHIAGFQERAPQSKWTDLVGGYLVVEIERLTVDRREKPGHTVAWAAGILSTRDEWRDFLGGKGADPAEALRVQFQRFKNKPVARLMRGAFKWRQHQGVLSTWESDLRDALRNPHP